MIKIPEDIQIRGEGVWKVISDNGISITLSSDSKFCLHYKAGEITEAIEDTLGIFCFSGYLAAEKFAMPSYIRAIEKNKIIEVIGLGEPTIPDNICKNVNGDLLEEFYGYLGYQARLRPWGKGSLDLDRPVVQTRQPLEDTVCYQRVFVLE